MGTEMPVPEVAAARSTAMRVAALFIDERPGARSHPVLTEADIERVTDLVFSRLHSDESQNVSELRLAAVQSRRRR